MIAYDDRVRELYRLPKSKLADLYGSSHTFVYLAAPLTKWSKDELISCILQDEFPQGRPLPNFVGADVCPVHGTVHVDRHIHTAVSS